MHVKSETMVLKVTIFTFSQGIAFFVQLPKFKKSLKIIKLSFWPILRSKVSIFQMNFPILRFSGLKVETLKAKNHVVFDEISDILQ